MRPPYQTGLSPYLQHSENDRSMWAQRDLELRRATAVAISRWLEQTLAEAERAVAGALPAGIVRYRVSTDGIRAEPLDGVLWLPVVPAGKPAALAPFNEAEQLEFRGAPEQALLRYRELVGSQVPL